MKINEGLIKEQAKGLVVAVSLLTFPLVGELKAEDLQKMTAGFDVQNIDISKNNFGLPPELMKKLGTIGINLENGTIEFGKLKIEGDGATKLFLSPQIGEHGQTPSVLLEYEKNFSVGPNQNLIIQFQGKVGPQNEFIYGGVRYNLKLN